MKSFFEKLFKTNNNKQDTDTLKKESDAKIRKDSIEITRDRIAKTSSQTEIKSK